MKIHIIGNGYPVPHPKFYGSSFIFEHKRNFYMIDCGPATTYKMALMGLSPLNVNHVFLTHHHFDHNVDFPCFALSRWDLSKGDEGQLNVYGPTHTKKFVDCLFGKDGAFFDDWNARVKSKVSQHVYESRGGILPRPAPSFDVKELRDERIELTDSCTVISTHVKHLEPYLESLAFRFDTNEGSIVFTGDCADCSELRKLCNGVDTLVIACAIGGKPKSPLSYQEQKVYKLYSDCITGTTQIADIVKNIRPKNVVLTHANFSAQGSKEKKVIEIARKWDGNIFVPDELSVLEF